MENIKVKTAVLLDTLKKNREEHIAEYAEAKVEYKKVIIKELAAKLKAAKAGKPFDFKFSPKPENFVESYNTIIAKLEWTTQDEIELTDSEVKQYIQNEWTWKNQFAVSTSSYIGGKA